MNRLLDWLLSLVWLMTVRLTGGGLRLLWALSMSLLNLLAWASRCVDILRRKLLVPAWRWQKPS